MKKYHNPEIEMIVLTNEDILTLSVATAAFDMGAVDDGTLWEW